jgi:hypothetical protein
MAESTLEWQKSLGWTVKHRPEIAPDAFLAGSADNPVEVLAQRMSKSNIERNSSREKYARYFCHTRACRCHHAEHVMHVIPQRIRVRTWLWTCGVMGMLFLPACQTTPTPESPPDAVRQRVEEEIYALDALRIGLAQSIASSETIDEETFNRVCRPVGQQARRVGEENGWVVKQLAVKYRNPAHRPDSQAAALFTRFEADPLLDSLWVRSSLNGTSGWRYVRRITVQPQCLACHGQRDQRPAFIVQNYPDDRAYDFQPGDLRGLYSVFVPDPK